MDENLHVQLYLECKFLARIYLIGTKRLLRSFFILRAVDKKFKNLVNSFLYRFDAEFTRQGQLVTACNGPRRNLVWWSWIEFKGTSTDMHSDLLIFTANHVFRWQDIVWPKLEGIVLIGIKYSGWHLESCGSR